MCRCSMSITILFRKSVKKKTCENRWREDMYWYYDRITMRLYKYTDNQKKWRILSRVPRGRFCVTRRVFWTTCAEKSDLTSRRRHYASIVWYWLEYDGGSAYLLRFFSDSSRSWFNTGDSFELWNGDVIAAAAACE